MQILLKTIVSFPVRLFSKISVFAMIDGSKIDKTSAVCAKSRIYRSNIDRYSYVCRNAVITDADIGSFCSVAPNVYIGGPVHPVSWVSTSPVFHGGKNIMHKNFSNQQFDAFSKTTVGNDVWIGENAMIKSGVTIGNGAVIGMGAIVTKDVGAYEIWGGNPAKCIKKRFDDDTINRLLESKWWDWEDEKLKLYAEKFGNPSAFTGDMK